MGLAEVKASGLDFDKQGALQGKRWRVVECLRGSLAVTIHGREFEGVSTGPGGDYFIRSNRK
jgi:hypothetical protein